MSAEHYTQKNPPRSDAAGIPGTLPELCDKILSLIAAYPEPCAKAVRRLTADSDGLRRIAIAFGAIGYEYSRQLFPWITDLQWFMMESHASQAMQSRSAAAVGQSVLSVFIDLLAESMDDEPDSSRDPFAFLNTLESSRLAAVVNGESPSELALIATYWGPGEVSRVLRVVPESVRVQTILQIARLQRLPESEARKAAARFAERLKAKLSAFSEPNPRASSEPNPLVSSAKPVVRPAAYAPGARAVPPPPPLPRIAPSGTGDSVESVQTEEALLASLRAESPELYRELAQGDYFKAIRR